MNGGRGKILYSHGETNARGVAILYKHGTNYEIHKVYGDLAGRLLIIDVSLNENRVAICNLYAPNDDKPEFFTSVLENLDSFSNAQTRLFYSNFGYCRLY